MWITNYSHVCKCCHGYYLHPFSMHPTSSVLTLQQLSNHFLPNGSRYVFLISATPLSPPHSLFSCLPLPPCRRPFFSASIPSWSTALRRTLPLFSPHWTKQAEQDSKTCWKTTINWRNFYRPHKTIAMLYCHWLYYHSVHQRQFCDHSDHHHVIWWHYLRCDCVLCMMTCGQYIIQCHANYVSCHNLWITQWLFEELGTVGSTH